jgi:hypothetical protein
MALGLSAFAASVVWGDLFLLAIGGRLARTQPQNSPARGSLWAGHGWSRLVLVAFTDR